MLRITELRLQLDHAQDALRKAIVTRLGVSDAELTAHTVFKRSYDARKKSAVVLIYTIDCQSVKRGNGIQTDPEKAWFTILRLYSPLEPFFTKAWHPSEVELVK
jgi:uncharacterized FAD-dependent dehydrogenase